MMATWIYSEWPFIVCQGQQEFCIFVNLTTPEQCRNINKKLSSLTSIYAWVLSSMSYLCRVQAINGFTRTAFLLGKDVYKTRGD